MQIGGVGSQILARSPAWTGTKDLLFAIYDPKDANRDGIVSVPEALAHARKRAIQTRWADREGAQEAPGSRERGFADRRDLNRDGVVSFSEIQAESLRNPSARIRPAVAPGTDPFPSSSFRDPRDGNGDGFVSPIEASAHALRHPEKASRQRDLLDEARFAPEDQNQDGVVTGVEERTYALEHPLAAGLLEPSPGAGTATPAGYTRSGTVIDLPPPGRLDFTA